MAKWIVRNTSQNPVGKGYLRGWLFGSRQYTQELDEAKPFPTKSEAFDVSGLGEVVRADVADAEHEAYMAQDWSGLNEQQ